MSHTPIYTENMRLARAHEAYSSWCAAAAFWHRAWAECPDGTREKAYCLVQAESCQRLAHAAKERILDGSPVIHKKRLCQDCHCSQTLPRDLQQCACACHPMDRMQGSGEVAHVCTQCQRRAAAYRAREEKPRNAIRPVLDIYRHIKADAAHQGRPVEAWLLAIKPETVRALEEAYEATEAGAPGVEA
jgi:hypothetical protein